MGTLQKRPRVNLLSTHHTALLLFTPGLVTKTSTHQ